MFSIFTVLNLGFNINHIIAFYTASQQNNKQHHNKQHHNKQCHN